MTPRLASFAVASTLVALMTACSTPEPPMEDEPTPAPPVPSAAPADTPSPTATPTEASTADPVTSTVVRFSSDQMAVDVTIDHGSPAVRDFLSMLPLLLSVEEFSGREKIAYLPRELDRSGTPGSDPDDGDLVYYAPWGNLGFYYDADGVGYSDDVVHIGTHDATLDQLTQLEGDSVTVAVVE